MDRKIIIRTGVGGYELFQEAMEESVGLKRVYIGKKVPRILRKLKTPIRKSVSGRYYKLVSNGKVFQDTAGRKGEYSRAHFGTDKEMAAFENLCRDGLSRL